MIAVGGKLTGTAWSAGPPGVCQETSSARTCGPPMAMKWMMTGLAALVVQLSVKRVVSQPARSASAISAPLLWIMVSALAAIRRFTLVGVTLFSELTAIDLAAPAVTAPSANRPRGAVPSEVVVPVHRISAFGVSPSPWTTVCVPFVLVKLPTLSTAAAVAGQIATRASAPAPRSARARRLFRKTSIRESRGTTPERSVDLGRA
jgi:hypothetical protein